MGDFQSTVYITAVLSIHSTDSSNSSRTNHLHYQAELTRQTVWLSGNALASINVVALRQTRLVLGWVAVCGRVNHFGM